MVVTKGALMAQAYAVCGAVIVGSDGSRVQYSKKCERCGYVEPGTTTVIKQHPFCKSRFSKAGHLAFMFR
jgi:hypothetical protein